WVPAGRVGPVTPSIGTASVRPDLRHHWRRSGSHLVPWPSAVSRLRYQTARLAACLPAASSTNTATYGRWYSATRSCGICTETVTSAAWAGTASRLPMATVSFRRMDGIPVVGSMDEQQREQHRHQQPQADVRPGHAPLARVQLQQEQTGDGEHHAGQGEDVDEPAPGRTGVAALVQVVEVGDGAARGALVLDLAAGAVDAQPGIAPRTWRREIDPALRPLRWLAADRGVECIRQPRSDRGG